MMLKWTMGVALVALGSSSVLADTAVQTAFDYELTCCETAADCGDGCCDEPSCGLTDGCGGDGCCDDVGCSSCCGGGGCSLLGDCCLGDAWSLSDEVCGPCAPFTIGGWTQVGYHSDNARLSRVNNDGLAFNDRPDRLNLHQQYFFAERVAQAPSHGWDWGFRADLLYGIDASKTQAFGNDPGNWDFQNGWDRGGGYGWAMPQLYGEVAFGDWSIKAGHFYTLVGYESVMAPNNFFYSRSLTAFNSEPFTHTGVLATYGGMDNIEVYGGWTAGWDTGFDQSLSGSNFLGGFSTGLTNDVTFTYITTIGNLGARSAGESGYSHSLVLDFALSNNLNYVIQSDLVGYDATVANAGTNNDQIGINQYLLYSINDCWAVGGRLEWWKSDGFSYNETTFGINYRPHANLIIRPEVRHDWTPSDAGAAARGFANADEYNNTSFGIDAILTY